MAKPKMRRIRGEYRPFFEALFTGKDFAKLSPDAKLAYMFAKGLSGAAGIRVWPAFVEQLAELTGMPTPRTKRALDELTRSQWLAIEGSVVWVVRGLDFEPQMCATNDKHRTWLREHLDSLPRVSMLAQFTATNAAWFTEPSDGLSDSLSDSPCDTNPNPVSLSQSLSQSLAQSQASSRVREDDATHRTRLAVAANKGLTERYGEQPVPIHWDARGTHECVAMLEAAGVELPFAERALYTFARDRQTADGRPPRSLKYFAGAVVDAWKAEAVQRVTAVTPAPTAAPTTEPAKSQEYFTAIRFAREGDEEWQDICRANGWEWEKAS